LRVSGRLRALPTGPGAANALFRGVAAGGPLIIKIRRDPLDDGSREAWGLRRAEGLGPALLAEATVAELRGQAAGAAAGRALSLDVGGVLVLEALDGRALSGAFLSEETLEQTGRLLARLHQLPTDRTARAPAIGSSPSVLEASVVELLDVAKGARAAPALVRGLWARWRALRGTLTGHKAARVLCHGDLRWHNMLSTPQGLRLIDFEHAGLGDAAFDLALFSARTPLSRHEELAVLDAYLDERPRDGALLDRFFLLKPAAELVGALAGWVDLIDVHSGHRPVVGDPDEVVQARRAGVQAALERVLDTPVELGVPTGEKGRR
jgi:Ser/Thr protein kinase RdoA (MazF antagonist)